MEKPKNYWLRVQIVYILGLLSIINALINTNLPFFISVLFPLSMLVMTILCITQSIRFKDIKYFLIGIIPLTLFILFVLRIAGSIYG